MTQDFQRHFTLNTGQIVVLLNVSLNLIFLVLIVCQDLFLMALPVVVFSCL